MKPKSKSSPAGESPRDENKNKNLGGLLRIRRRFRRAASPIPIAMTSRTVGKKQVKRWKQVSTLRRRRAICFCLFFFCFWCVFILRERSPSEARCCAKEKTESSRPKLRPIQAPPPPDGAFRLLWPSRAPPPAAGHRAQPTRAKFRIAGPSQSGPGQVLLQV